MKHIHYKYDYFAKKLLECRQAKSDGIKLADITNELIYDVWYSLLDEHVAFRGNLNGITKNVTNTGEHYLKLKYVQNKVDYCVLFTVDEHNLLFKFICINASQPITISITIPPSEDCLKEIVDTAMRKIINCIDENKLEIKTTNTLLNKKGD